MPKPKSGEDAKVPLQAVVLADSFTQAFRPITLERPKALLPLCNVPMIEYVLEFLSTNGVEEVFVFCCAHAEQIVEYLENSPWCQNSSGTNFVVHTVVSTNCISAGEALRLIDHRHVIRADFVLMHGDVVANMDLKKVLHAHNARRKKEKLAIMTLCFKPTTQALRETRFGEGNLIVVTDPDTNRVLHYETHAPPNEADSSFGDGEQKKAQKKPQLPPLSLDASLFSDHPSIKISTDLLDCHVDICAPEVLYLFTDNFDYQNLRRDFVVGTLNERELGNNLYAHVLASDEYAVRVDSLRTYDAVSKDVIQRWTYPMVPDTNALPRGTSSTYKMEWPNVYSDANARVHASAKIGAGCVFGDGCVIGAGCVVEQSTFGKNTRVGANVTVKGSYLQTNVTIHDNATVTSAFAADGVVVHENATIGKGAVLSYDVVVGPGQIVGDYSRVSLATQPVMDDDEYDSDDDGLEVGSLPSVSDGRRVSVGGGGSLGARAKAQNFGGRATLKDSDSDDDAKDVKGPRCAFTLTDREEDALAKAKSGLPSVDGVGKQVWSVDALGAAGAGNLWTAHASDLRNLWRYSIAPAPFARARLAYHNDDALDSDDDATHTRGGTGDPSFGNGSDSESGNEFGDDADQAETVFRREVAETFLRCVKHGYAEANAVVELQGLKMAENRTFADIARYVLMTVLGLALPAPKDVQKENARLYPVTSPASVPELLKVTRKKVERWAPLLARFLKSEDDQVEMLLTLEDYCSEETVFTGMGGSALTPAFPKILHMLYDMDVLSEVSVLAWSAEKEGAEEEDKKFLKLAKPFVEWLKEADEESEEETETESDSE